MIYPSIDKLLTKIDSKYKLVHVAAKRAREMNDNNLYQMKENEYKQSKAVGRALEEFSADMIEVVEKK